jgi:hypothetical protein
VERITGSPFASISCQITFIVRRGGKATCPSPMVACRSASATISSADSCRPESSSSLTS